MAAQMEVPTPMSGMPEFPVKVKPEPHDWSAYSQSSSGNVYTNLDAPQPPPPPPSHPQNGMMPAPINIMPCDDPAPLHPPVPQAPPTQPQTTPKKKKGRPKKIKEEPKDGTQLPGDVKIKQEKITDNMPVKKKRDRFKGTTEEEVAKRTLPDLICPNLDILIIGINPGLTAAYMGHHYAGPGNHFWKCMYLSGIIPEQLNGKLDYKMLDYGIGSTNIVERTTRGSSDLSRKEIQEGAVILREKILKYKPKIAVFNGKGIYEVFCGNKNFHFGKQPEHFPECPETLVYVMPSSSARCSQLPRAVDKVPFYASLKRLRDYLRGRIPHLDDSEVCFPDLELKVVPKVEKDADGNPIKKEPPEPKLDKDGNPVAKKKPGPKPKNTSPTKKTPPAKKAPRKRKSTGKTPEHPAPVVENGQQQQQQQQQPPTQQIVIAPDGSQQQQHPDAAHAMVKQEPGTQGMGGGYPGFHPPNNGTPPQQQQQQQPPGAPAAGLEDLFGGGGSNLVKQEDLSELAQFGIVPGNFGPPPPQFGSPPPAHSAPYGGPPFHRPGFPSSVHVQDPFEDSVRGRQGSAFMAPNVTSPPNTHAPPMHPYWSFPNQYQGQPGFTSPPMPAHQHRPPNFSSPPFSSPGASPFSSPPGQQPPFSSPPANQQQPAAVSTPQPASQTTTSSPSTPSTPTTSP